MGTIEQMRPFCPSQTHVVVAGVAETEWAWEPGAMVRGVTSPELQELHGAAVEPDGVAELPWYSKGGGSDGSSH